MNPPKPAARPRRVSLWRYLRLFRQDILSAQPEHLYHAWMAEFRTSFFRSFLINDPALLHRVLNVRADDFPKSRRVTEGLRLLLGQSVFVTNVAHWKRQRRIIDPAFEGGLLRDTFPAMLAAADAAVARLGTVGNGPVEIEGEASHAAADIIFRTLFSIPIEHKLAKDVFEAFRDHQRSQPILNLAAFLPLPSWMPRLFRREARATARRIRSLIEELTAQRLTEIAAGSAPNDLATKIITTTDPETGERFDLAEMVYQVAIFFLAGHETSASSLSWALYLVATHPEWQDKVAQEAADLGPEFSSLSSLRITRDVFREALRLYPPVPMMVREASQLEEFRGRKVARGSQVVLSPWHLHRHERLWPNPDGFDPARRSTEEGKASAREAYMPFSSGPRVCTGAGFAMAEGVVMLSKLVGAFSFASIEGRVPQPVAHLTVRAKDGIWLAATPRDSIRS